MNNNSEKIIQEEFSDHTEKTIYPMLRRKIVEQMTANPMTLEILNEEKEEKKINKLFKRILLKGEEASKAMSILENIGDTNNWRDISIDLETELTEKGRAVIVFYKDGERYNLIVPTNIITRLDPITKELNFLIIIRYLQSGDMVNVVTETRTLDFTKYEVMEAGTDSGFGAIDIGTLKKNMKYDWKEGKLKSDGSKLNKLSKEKIKEFLKLQPSLAGVEFDEEIKNNEPFIFAQYFQNIKTRNNKGRPDINIETSSHLAKIIDTLYPRFAYDLQFDKPRVITSQEMGTSFLARNKEAQNMFDNGFAVRNNNMYYPMGDAGTGLEFHTTTNQNMQYLIQLYSVFVKKICEHNGFHLASDDQAGKNITDFGTKTERQMEVLRLEAKVSNRIWSYKKLIQKIIKTAIGKNISLKSILIDISPHQVVDLKEAISNEIVLMQSGLSDAQTSLKRLPFYNGSIEDAERDIEIFGLNNIERLKKQLDAMPVQEPSDANMNNPQGSNKPNKQLTNWAKQGGK